MRVRACEPDASGNGGMEDKKTVRISRYEVTKTPREDIRIRIRFLFRFLVPPESNQSL